MDLHSKMTMYITSTMTSPVTKTAKTSKWLRLQSCYHTRERQLLYLRSYLYLKFLNINNNNKKEKNDLELKALKNSTVATQLEHKWLNVIHKCARIVQVRVQSRLRLRLDIQ